MFDNDDVLTYGDFGDRDLFISETKQALSEKTFGPAFNSFISTLVNGEIFAIITARSADSKTIRSAVEVIIYEYLSDQQQSEMIENLLQFNDLFGSNEENIIENFLNECEFVGVNSNAFIKKYGNIVDISNPEEGKKLALTNFTKRVQAYGKVSKKDVKLGFSDDDKANVNSVIKHFNEIDDVYDVDFYVFDTSNPKLNGGLRTKI